MRQRKGEAARSHWRRVVAEQERSGLTAAEPARLEVRAGGRSVMVPAGFGREHLRAVLAALEEGR